MFNKLFIAALFAASFMTAKAQSINVINQCGEKSHIINFVRADAYSNPLQHYRCVKEEFPTYRLEVGNYEFDNLNIPADEDWYCEIRKAGVVTRKGILTLGRFWTILSEDMTILIVIAPKLKCLDCN